MDRNRIYQSIRHQSITLPAWASARTLWLLLAGLAFLILTLASMPHAAAAEKPADWLRAEGNQIVDESGRPVVLRGANIVRYNWKWPDERAMEEDFVVARAFTTPVDRGGWGANAFTLWVESNPVNDNDREYMAWMDGMVAIARENHAYVILAWHKDDPPGEHPRHITDAGIEAMAAVARRYRDVPNVLYATQAEPGNGGRRNAQLSWDDLKPHQERTIDAIRREHPRALIGVAGTVWSQRVEGMLRDPIERDNIFVKPHIYASMPDIISARRIDRIAQRWPVVIGEFGTGGRMSNDDSRALIRYADAHLSGWQAWNLSDIGRPLMLSSHRETTPTSFGRAVKTELARPAADAPALAAASLPLRINVGGPEVQDPHGHTWLADRPYLRGLGWGYTDPDGASGRATHDLPDQHADAYPVLATERWGLAGYRVELPDGAYDLRLHFAETHTEITGPGQRTFDLTVQGDLIAAELDIFALAGPGAPLVKTLLGLEVTGGLLDIQFGLKQDHPMLKAIEVHPAGALTALALTDGP